MCSTHTSFICIWFAAMWYLNSQVQWWNVFKYICIEEQTGSQCVKDSGSGHSEYINDSGPGHSEYVNNLSTTQGQVALNMSTTCQWLRLRLLWVCQLFVIWHHTDSDRSGPGAPANSDLSQPPTYPWHFGGESVWVTDRLRLTQTLLTKHKLQWMGNFQE